MNIKDFEFNDNEPIYLQIIDLIRRAIATGQLMPGDKLPSVREMSSSLGVNPNTLQRAYGELERLSITYTRRGMGSFVSEGHNEPNKLQEQMGIEISEKYLRDMNAIGIDKDKAIKILEGIDV